MSSLKIGEDIFFALMIKVLLSKQDIDRILSRMAHEIIERNKGSENLRLVGIQRGGVHLAKRLAAKIKSVDRVDIPVGFLDISLYRDDIGMRKEHPMVRKTEIPFDITDIKVILVDDVLFTGRSIRAALDALMDFGRPAQIQLAILIDRGHRELPIRADYAGKNIPTGRNETVEVRLEEEGMEDGVILYSSDERTEPGAGGEAH